MITIGLILTSISENNKRLIDNQTPPFTAAIMWTTLRTSHNPQDTHNQYTLLQEFIGTYQKPKETLTEFNGRLAGIQDAILSSFPAGATAADVVNILLPWITLNHLVDSRENKIFVSSLKVMGGITRGAINTAFINEQCNCDTKKNQSSPLKSEGANYTNKGNNNKLNPNSPKWSDQSLGIVRIYERTCQVAKDQPFQGL